MGRWSFDGDVDEWRMDVAYKLGESDSDNVLDVVGRKWLTNGGRR